MDDEKRRNTTSITKLSKITKFDGSAIEAPRAFLDVHVDRFLRWIEYDNGNRIFAETQVDQTITFQFPLEIRSLSKKTYLQNELNKLITEERIDEDFWDEFIETVLVNFQNLVESAIERKSGEIILSVELIVVNEEPFDEKRFLEYIISDRSMILERNGDDDDYVESFQRVLCTLRSKMDIVETMTFKKYVSSGGSLRGECLICLNEILEGEKILKMPCSHLFHCECVTGLLKTRTTCPLCRYELKIDAIESIRCED